jgi:hypothetical protein
VVDDPIRIQRCGGGRRSVHGGTLANVSRLPGVLGAPTLHGAGAQKGPEGPSARRLPSPDWFREYQPASRTRRPFFHSALGLDVCRPLTKDEHRVRFPAGAPHPRVGLLMAGHHRYGSPTLRATVRISPAFGDSRAE